jgi:hypothetical protein
VVIVSGEAALEWELALVATQATRLLNATGAAIPEPLWQQRWLLAIMGRIAGGLLGAGRLRLYGRTLNDQLFVVNPRLIWACRTATPDWRAAISACRLRWASRITWGISGFPSAGCSLSVGLSSNRLTLRCISRQWCTVGRKHPPWWRQYGCQRLGR